MADPANVARAWFLKFWNERSLDAARQVADANSVFHNVDAPGGSIKGVENFFGFYNTALKAFPDIHFTIDHLVESGDTAAIRWTAKATHHGEWMGRAATKKALQLSGMGFVKVANGKIVEAWDEWDKLRLLSDIDGH